MNKTKYPISISHSLGKTLKEHLLEPLDGNLPADQWHEWLAQVGYAICKVPEILT